MSDSLSSTKLYLEDYLKTFRNSLQNMNLTSASLFNATHENLINVSEVLRVSEMVRNAVFDVITAKMGKISEMKDNLTLSQVEEFANTQAKATVDKLNNVVTKTVE